MMFGLPIGFFMEGAVAILLALTIGYCVVLNSRLKRLHADRDALRLMVNDLVGATNLANQAIKELKATAVEADLGLKARLDEAERFGIELANHVTAGTTLIERITRIASAVRQHQTQAQAQAPDAAQQSSVDPEDQLVAVEQPNKIQSALMQLSTRVRSRRDAA
jgi:hypothetical protein